MSRVRFGNYQDIPAEVYSGFNGFPLPYLNLSVSGLTTVDYARLIKWWWRVKNWTLSTSWSLFDTASGDTFTFQNGAQTPSVGPPTRADELDLIDPTITPFFGSTSANNGGFGFSPMTTIRKSGSNLYPFAIMDSKLGNAPFGSASDVTFSFVDFAPSTGIFTTTIDGIDFTTYYLLGGAGGVPGPGSMTLDPVEYWSYDGIYNTSTGAVNPGKSPLDP